MSERSQDGPWAGRKLHFIAIGGAGMSGLASIAHRLGAEVTGSDRAESSYLERLRLAGLSPRVGHDAEGVPDGADVVVSSAISEDNPELARARERGLRVLHRGELLAEICRLKRLIAVAGAHGKTTTAGLITHALQAAGASPSYLVGGELNRIDDDVSTSNAGWSTGEWIVAEADESDGSFLELAPEIAVITNIELDHHSHWASERALRAAFGRFVAGARGVVCGADAGAPAGEESARWLRTGVESIAAGSGTAGARHRDSSRLDVTAINVAVGPRGSTFTARLPQGARLEVSIPIRGAHNVLNALAALGALYLVADGDMDQLESLAAGLGTFGGVARRLERKGSHNGAEIFDDYAHHPTEVAAALSSFADPAPCRLIAVFQPHLYSRTKALAGRFGKALAAADEIMVLDVYPARERPEGELAGVSGRAVAEAAADHAGGRPVWWLEDLDTAERALRSRLRKGDVLVTLGAGDVCELADRLARSAEGETHPVDAAGEIEAAESQ